MEKSAFLNDGIDATEVKVPKKPDVKVKGKFWDNLNNVLNHVSEGVDTLDSALNKAKSQPESSQPAQTSPAKQPIPWQTIGIGLGGAAGLYLLVKALTR